MGSGFGGSFLVFFLSGPFSEATRCGLGIGTAIGHAGSSSRGRPMTEAEWLTTTSTYNMLTRSPAVCDQRRKLWLFGCACFRRQWHLLVDQRTRRYVETAERHIDGHCSDCEIDAAWESFDTAWRDDSLASDGHLDPYRALRKLTGRISPYGSLDLACRVAEGFACYATKTHHTDTGDDWDEEKSANWKSHDRQEIKDQADLLRDIFGNPFRPVTFSPSWSTGTALSLAQGMYESRDFSAMPILADALQDAGCDSADVLDHCRGPGPHVRGCWVVDLVLGKD